VEKQLSIVFGLLIGGMWTAEILLGNLCATPVFGNLREEYPRVYAMAAWFALGAVVVTAIGGLVALTPELSSFIYWDMLGGALNHLWIGPLLGLTVGGIGAIAGKLARRGAAMTPPPPRSSSLC
jgi:hypothetical protein